MTEARSHKVRGLKRTKKIVGAGIVYIEHSIIGKLSGTINCWSADLSAPRQSTCGPVIFSHNVMYIQDCESNQI